MDATNTNSIDSLLKLQNTLQKYSIGLPVLITIAMLEDDELNLSYISDKLGVSTAYMTSLRDTAEERGFIQIATSLDRRKKCYNITDKGRELLASCRQ